jgi:Zn-dependent protease with chaperone function
MTSFRYPNEQFILFITISLILVVGVLAAGATICLLPLLVLVFVLIAYQMNRSHHFQLVHQGMRITLQNAPALSKLAEECTRRLRASQVELFVVPSRELNAYTFGLDDPRVVVMYSSLLKYMDADELRFIFGHELGHVLLGHTWLNTILGGMSGVPASLGIALVMVLAFRSWNRACEYSADRAGLLACGNPDKAISALVKLVYREADTPQEMEVALDQIAKQDDSIVNVMAETLDTHPMIARRIEQLKAFAATEQYRRLQVQVNQQAAA